MILAILLGAALLTWYVDKTFDGVTSLVNETGANVKKSKTGEFRDLGIQGLLLIPKEEEKIQEYNQCHINLFYLIKRGTLLNWCIIEKILKNTFVLINI